MPVDRPGNRRSATSRLVRGIGANVYSQVALVAIQLAYVPVLASHWGLEMYGGWLMLLTVPAYLGLADFGFAWAAGNDMAIKFAQGNQQDAQRIFQATRTLVLLLSVTLLGVAAAIVLGFPDSRLETLQKLTHQHARLTILILVAYSVLSIQNSVTMSGLRAVGSYAVGIAGLTTIQLVECAVTLMAVILGGGIIAAVAAMAGTRAIGSILLAMALKYRAPWLTRMEGVSAVKEILPLLSPALAVMAIPIAQSLMLQGPVLIVGWAAGAFAVPAFTATRTASRVALQLTGVVNHAIMPEFTVAVAERNAAKSDRLALISILTSLLVGIPICLLIVLIGKRLIDIWTHHSIHAAEGLLVTMSVSMLMSCLWVPISNLMLAMNRQSAFSYYYCLAAAGCVLLAYPLARVFGAEGAAIALVVLDAVMFMRVFRIATRTEIFNVHGLWPRLGDLFEHVRRQI